jgi:hypothetical protein
MKDFWGKPNCPKCGSIKGFRFHYDPTEDNILYPNECKNCGCFCNVFGEIKKKQFERRNSYLPMPFMLVFSQLKKKFTNSYFAAAIINVSICVCVELVAYFTKSP